RRGRVALGQEARRQAQRAEIDRSRPRGTRPARADDDLRGAAADVAHRDAFGNVVERGDGAFPGERPLLVGAQDPYRHAGSAGERGGELVAVRALPPWRGDEDLAALP